MPSSSTLPTQPHIDAMPHALDIPAQFQQALAMHQNGQLASAQALYEAILRVQPGHADAWHLLGVVALQSNQLQQALDCIGRAIGINPRQAGFYINQGNVLKALQQPEAALASFEHAIAHQPDLADAHALRATTLLELQQFEAAITCLDTFIALQPDAAQAYFYRGIAQQQLNQLDAAIANYDRAIALEPAFAQAYVNRGVALQALKHFDTAVSSYDHAIALQPDLAATHFNRGSALQELHRLKDCIASYDRAIALQPDHAQAYNNRAIALKDLGQAAAAVASYDQAIALVPGYADAWANRGIALDVLRKAEEAEHSYRRALEIDPTLTEAHHNLALSQLTRGNIQAAMQGFRNALAVEPHRDDAHSALLQCFSSDTDVNAATLFAEHLRFGAQFEAPLRPHWLPHANPKDALRALKIGFVSGDFYSHAVATFIEPVLQQLAQSSAVSLYAYYNHTVQDAVTQRLKASFDQWRDVAKLAHTELAHTIRADGIDILIDLAGHTGRNRLATLAHKPAPIQASWIGFPGTTGLQSVDYYLTDKYFLPQAEFAHQFTEKLVYLPATTPFLPFEGAPPVNALPARTNGYITFGSFNKLKKFSPAVIALWARVLHAHPGSRMVLGGMESSDNPTVLQWFANEGIAADRLRFYPVSDMPTYLGLHHQVDLCLDTFPYSGGTTTWHAVWMGVPTLILSGPTPTCRTGNFVLGHAGLLAFQANSPQEFVDISVDWAQRLDELATIRASLRDRFRASPVGQPAVIVQALEQAFRTMWQRWCQQLPPESFTIE